MALYAISDLHLAFTTDKPMDIFGEKWIKHDEKIKENWISKIKKEDTVLIAGDISWSMKSSDSKGDLDWINDLPGKKIISKGNHDYWWNTLKKMREFIYDNKFDNIDFLYNNSFEYENIAIVGTRGWAFGDSDEDMKMNHREAERLKLSINDAVKMKI